MVNLVLCHLGGLLFIPYMLNTSPEESADMSAKEHYQGVALPSLLLAAILMGYNYAWLQSARRLDASLTNAIFQTSVALVCAASVLVFGEPLTRGRALGVAMALCGSALAAGVGSTTLVKLFPSGAPTSGPVASFASATNFRTGVGLALFASVGYAVYQVLFKYLYSRAKNDVRFLAYFGIWVSGWHVAFSPMVLVAAWLGFEDITLPHTTLSIVGTAASALIASTVNGLYLCIVMWGSPMLLPAVSALSVPLTVSFDYFLHGVRPATVEIIGHSMVAASVYLIIQARPTTSPRMMKMPIGGRDTA
jgi:drug/metabolite transporter (DMT)-like permease